VAISNAAFAHPYLPIFGLWATAVGTIKNYPNFWEGKGKGIYLFPKFYTEFSTDNQKQKRPPKRSYNFLSGLFFFFSFD
jgi:hypothetical protein